MKGRLKYDDESRQLSGGSELREGGREAEGAGGRVCLARMELLIQEKARKMMEGVSNMMPTVDKVGASVEQLLFACGHRRWPRKPVKI